METRKLKKRSHPRDGFLCQRFDILFSREYFGIFSNFLRGTAMNYARDVSKFLSARSYENNLIDCLKFRLNFRQNRDKKDYNVYCFYFVFFFLTFLHFAKLINTPSRREFTFLAVNNLILRQKCLRTHNPSYRGVQACLKSDIVIRHSTCQPNAYAGVRQWIARSGARI